MADNNSDKTAMIGLDQETINRELQKAKESPDCFVIVRGNPMGHRFFLEKEESIIGRDPSADISIPDQLVSRKHAKVVRNNGQVTIEDLKSSNGTVVNGSKLEAGKVITLAKEDMIKLGNIVLKFLPAGHIEIVYYGNFNQKATIDALTQCFNKGYFLEAIEAEVKRAKALSNPLSLMFFDLDHFKKVNDTHGHDAGDYVLVEFSKLVRESGLYKQKDIFARYGGEEFCLLMPGSTKEDTAKVAEAIRAKIHTHEFIFKGVRIPVTTSLGVAEIKDEMGSAEFIKAADQALYTSKQSGRNRVTVAD
jgi:two-component system cell cycle response regulator